MKKKNHIDDLKKLTAYEYLCLVNAACRNRYEYDKDMLV